MTQATSANKGMQCATGQVLSGGACVPLSQLVPNTSCAYGQVSSGGSCVPLSTLTPPTTSCPTGYVLSGGNCVPLSSPTTPAPTSCGGGAFTLVWGVGCSYSNRGRLRKRKKSYAKTGLASRVVGVPLVTPAGLRLGLVENSVLCGDDPRSCTHRRCAHRQQSPVAASYGRC